MARQYITQPGEFARTARQWTQSYATKELAEAPDAKVRRVPAPCVCIFGVCGWGIPLTPQRCALQVSHGSWKGGLVIAGAVRWGERS